MPSIVGSVEIQASPMVIWTVLAKHLEHPQFYEKTSSPSNQIRGAGGIPLTDRRTGLGVRTRWNYEFKGHRYTWDDEVTAWEEGRRISWKAISSWAMVDSFELTQAGAVTRVVYRMAYKFPYGPLGWLLARLVYHRHIEQNIHETLRGLKSSAESIATLTRGSSKP